MVEINLFSLLLSYLMCSAFMLMFILIVKSPNIAINLSPGVLVLVFLLPVIRIVIPIDIPHFTNVIQSFNILPELVSLITKSITVSFLNFSFDLSIVKILLGVWIIGFIRSIYLLIVNYFKLVTGLSKVPETDDKMILSILEKIKLKENYSFSVKVICCDIISAPLEYGFFKQTILLPKENLCFDEISMILSHELSHFKLKTNWIKLFTALLVSIFWWNPIFSRFERTAETILEVFCDKYVLKNETKEIRIKYLECLIKSMKNSVKRKKNQSKFRLAYGFGDINFNRSLVKQRFQLVLKVNAAKHPVNLVMSILLLLIFVFSYRILIQPAYMPDEKELIYIPENEYQYIIYEDGDYILFVNGERYLRLQEITETFQNIPILNLDGEKGVIQ